MNKNSNTTFGSASVCKNRRPAQSWASGLRGGTAIGNAGTAVAPQRTIDWDEIARNDLRNASYHEAGHAVVCHHFRIPWFLSRFEQTQATMETRGAGAQLSYIPVEGVTPFRLAVVGWAGVMTESLREDGDEYQCFETYTEFEEMSSSDHRLVEGTPFRWRALTTASRILKRQWADVEWNATEFLERHRLGLVVGW
jgi:hypothetical protein